MGGIYLASLNFNTTNSTFRQLLGNGLRYRVPSFQRDYSWRDEEWDDLWADMLDVTSENGETAHYMGYLVLQSHDNKSFDIIDGQQRITTLSIVILAGLAFLKERIEADDSVVNNQRRLDQLRNSYIGYLDPVTLVSNAKLGLNRHSNDFYQNYLVPLERLPKRGITAASRLLGQAFEWFLHKIHHQFKDASDPGMALAAFVDKLVDRLFFTVITVTDELNAYKVFETLNARGVRLSSTDLLKNYLFSVVSDGGKATADLDVLENLWERIIGYLGKENFSEFLRFYWNGRQRAVRKAELFKAIRKNIRDREDAFKLVQSLSRSSEYYAALRDPSDSRWSMEEGEWLRLLHLFGVRQPLVVLLVAYDAYFETKREDFRKVLRSLLVISVRYNVIGSKQANEQESIYNHVALQAHLQTYQSVTELIKALRPVYVDDKGFKADFSSKSLRTSSSRNKKVVRYLLFEIEKQITQRDFDRESAAYNLEHVLPENPSDAWSYLDELSQERMMYRIGNMTLMKTKPNQRLGNSNYEAKREVYRDSDFQITRSIAENYDVWEEKVVDARQLQLAKKACTIWKIDF